MRVYFCSSLAYCKSCYVYVCIPVCIHTQIIVERIYMCEEEMLSCLVQMSVYFRQWADREWWELKNKFYAVRSHRQHKELT